MPNLLLYHMYRNASGPSYLRLEKLETASGAYDDGLYYFFNKDVKPEHVQFVMKTESPEVESCDLRFTSINTTTPTVFTKIPWQDVFFFRFGYFNYQKLNLVSMVNMFKQDVWYTVDLLINWRSQTVTVYVDKELKASDIFFTKKKTEVPSANTLVLYNLTPGSTCHIRAI